MSVTISTTNKPLNPRAQDLSPKGYNRASLYSGKALDFDGVNDALSTDYAPSSNIQTVAYWVKLDSLTTNYALGGFVGSLNQFGLYYWGANANKNFGFNTWSADSYGVILPDFVDDWFYVVAEYNFSDFTQSKLFVNGQELSISQTLGTTLQRTTASRTFQIDSPSASSQEFDGKISGVKVFEGSLTAAQVSDLYLNPEKIVPDGVASSALKLWLPMMEGAGTKCLDGASLNTATERVENGDFSDGTTGWVGNPETTLSVSNGQLDIQSGSGSGEYGAAFSEVNFTSGKYYLIQLDVISCDVPSQIRIGSSNSAINYSTNIWNSGEIGVGTHSTIWYAASSSTYLSIGGRNDITTLVIDNVSVKEISVGDISGATWTHGIGAPVAQTSVIDWNKRVLDKTNEFLIPQGLTSGRDLLGNLFESARNPYALNLDGASWAEVHDNASLDFGTGEFTMEVWVNGAFVNVGSSYNSILTLGDTVTSNDTATLNSRASQYNFTINLNGLNFSTIDLGAWTHLVITRNNSGLISLYYNGTLDNFAAGYTYNVTNAANPRIGADATSVRYYSDQIALPRIYNRALTATEVARNYNADRSKFGL